MRSEFVPDPHSATPVPATSERLITLCLCFGILHRTLPLGAVIVVLALSGCTRPEEVGAQPEGQGEDAATSGAGDSGDGPENEPGVDGSPDSGSRPELVPDAELTNDSDGGSDERDGAVEPAEDAGDAEDASVETPDNGASGPDTADDVPVPDSGPTTQPSGGEDEGCEGGRYYYPNISAASESGAFIARIADVAEDPASPGWFTLTVQLFEDTGDWAAGRSLRMTIVVPGFETVDVGLQETERPGIYVTPGSFALPAADRWVLTVQVSASSDGAVLDEVEFVLCQGTQ